jgi:hypothetical protein
MEWEGIFYSFLFRLNPAQHEPRHELQRLAALALFASVHICSYGGVSICDDPKKARRYGIVKVDLIA